MILLFKLITITSILVLGWRIVISNGMLLHNVFLWAEEKSESNKLYEWIICPFCSPTIFSFAGYAFAYLTKIVHFDNWYIIFYYPLCVSGSSIISGFVWTLYELANEVKDRNDAQKDFFLKNEENVNEEEYYSVHN